MLEKKFRNENTISVWRSSKELGEKTLQKCWVTLQQLWEGALSYNSTSFLQVCYLGGSNASEIFGLIKVDIIHLEGQIC